MIQSMTGFGKASGDCQLGSVEITIQSVNNRYFIIRSYLSEPLQPLQLNIEKFVKKRLIRGSAVLTVKTKEEKTPTYRINKELAKWYVGEIAHLLLEVNDDEVLIDEQFDNLTPKGIFVNHEFSVGSLLNLPGIIQESEENSVF